MKRAPVIAGTVLTAAVIVGLWFASQATDDGGVLALAALSVEFRQDGLRVPDNLDQRYRAACNAGYEPACTWREIRADGGELSDVNESFSGACAAADPVACVAVGWANTQIRHGSPTMSALSPPNGVAAFKYACEVGLDRGCWELARLTSAGIGLAVSPQGETYNRLCDAGEPRACLDAKRPEAACSAGYARGCAAAGEPEIACEMGLLEACPPTMEICVDGGLAACLTVGDEDALTVACQAKDPVGCARLGAELLDSGERRRAAASFTVACKGGNGVGCTQLAEVHRSDGDVVAAYAVHQRACQVGHLANCEAQAHMMRAGEGVGADGYEADELLRAICRAGRTSACVEPTSQ